MDYPTIKITKLKPHPQNPRTHTDEQIQKIARSIKELGWGRPIIISTDYYILAGHGAWEAAERLGCEEVPYRMMAHKHDTPEALAYMVADNKLTDESTWNYSDLELVFEDIKLEHFDVTLTGFEDTETIIPDYELPDSEPEYDETIAEDVETIKCPECGHEFPK
ncbi:MAG TPA: ParB/Srx family N-terminal domain-containing protein [Methanobacteriaceae archaeon]|nr:ParB/Srx family N-terminal domain-containing protein [Methanobacteriaceae archaeon]